MIIIGIIVAHAAISDVKKYELERNKRAFFDLKEIVLSQIPNYNGMIFAIYLPFIIYHVYQYI